MTDNLLDLSEEAFTEHVEDVIRDLLQSKHLYQNISVDPNNVIDTILKKRKIPIQESEKKLVFYFYQLTKQKWDIRKFLNPTQRQARRVEMYNAKKRYPIIQPPDVKLYCNICKRIEPFDLTSVLDIFYNQPSSKDKESKITQIFSLSYLCQSCKTVPDVFLIRREGFRLTLSGRTPIEHIDVPKVIHESIHKFYSGAILAHQSGHTLAGNFYLRTLVEQWARSITKDFKSRDADKVMDNYMALLPLDFKKRFDSMKSLYGKLSADVHNAKGSEKLFDNALKQIEKHFDARRLFDL